MNKLLAGSLDRLAEHVCGNWKGSPYRSGPMLVRLFNAFGGNDTYPSGGGFPSRQTYTEERLRDLNGKPAMAALVEQVFDPLEFEKAGLDADAAVADINKFLARDQLHVVLTAQGARLRPLAGASVAFSAPSVARPASQAFISEHIAKCDAKLTAGDYGGAVTNARSLCEEVLCDLERQLDPGATSYDGDLGKLFKRVRKLLNMDPEVYKERDDVAQVLRGLTSIVDGLSGMSNELGDRHGGSGAKAKRHHAVLAVNAANTLCTFVLESFAQRAAASFKREAQGVP